MDWNKMVKMTVPVGLCGWQQRGSLTINGRTTEFQVGVATELPEPVAERIKALIADAEEKAEHVQPLQPWMQHVTGADGVARWEPRLAYTETEEVVILPETEVIPAEGLENTFELTEPLSAPLSRGMKCTVTYNDVKYNCNVQETPVDEGVNLLSLGNAGALMGEEGTGEPFAFAVVPEGEQNGVYAQVFALDGAETVNISITAVEETVKTIDPKFLPGSSAGAGGGVIYIDTEITAPYTEVVAYADAACTTPLTYEQGKAIVGTGCALSHKAENGETLTFVPAFTHAFDAHKQVMCFVSVLDESMMLVTTTVDVGFAGE